jgi:hypothetical protein
LGRAAGTLASVLHNRIIFIVLALGLFVAACGGGIADVTTTTSGETTTTSGETTTTSGDSSTTTEGTTTTEETTTTTEATGTTSGGGDDPPDEFVELIEATERVRGLEFFDPPTITFVSDEELARRVAAEIEEELDPDELVIDQALFVLLGLWDPERDLGQAYTDLYAEQVAGFYDHDTGEMVVSAAAELTPLRKTIVVHELVHALTDQHFGFGAELDRLVDEERYHEAAALQALVEGDATYFQIVYLQEMSTAEQLQAVTESLDVDTTVLDSLPEWLGEDLTWPYDGGYVFVERLVAANGILGVDQAYRLVPETTEQIIHPDAYFANEPSLEVALPDTVVTGYEIYEAGSLGEWNVDLLLLDGASPGEAVIASSGWGGDRYRILWNGQDVAMVFRFEGDSPADGDELADALVEALSSSMAVGTPRTDQEARTTTMSGADYAFVGRDGAAVVLVVASDPVAGSEFTAQLLPADS